ncbi:endo-beta-N-acetylglucosaminidase [Streptomyces buecherae]|uniref:endo-beta-N-acetylglucosaminidase n=1 Tax=Streptomyces buecherae TaxID=2763006 RepID=UPI00378FE99D
MATSSAHGEGSTKGVLSQFGVPYVPYWHPGHSELPSGGRALLDWNPNQGQDQDGVFHRSRVPLRPRRQDARLKAHPNARAGEGQVMSCAEFWGTGENPPQGVASSRYYAFGYWQYVQILVFWAGTAGGGLICPPNGHVTDAAHRNGVKVYGSVFFPTPSHGGKEAWVRDFTTKTKNGTYPVVDKLVEVAQYFGFDGWFINYETLTRGDPAVRDALAYGRARTTPDTAGSVDFTWYEMQQRDLNNHNAQFLQNGSQRVCDSLFVDYYWYDTNLTNSKNKAGEIKRSVYDLHFGLELVEEKNWDERLTLLFTKDNTHRGSLALYKAHTVSTPSKGCSDTEWTQGFYRKEADFWVGTNHDPSHSPNSGFPGIARYIAEARPQQELPFVTHFNTGHGHSYHHAGAVVRHGGWANLALQDVLPTYRWLTGADAGGALGASLSFRDAWEGGSCLMLDTTHLVPGSSAWTRLYQLYLPTTDRTRITVRAKTPPFWENGNGGALEALVATDAAPKKLLAVPLTRQSEDQAGWTTYTATLPENTYWQPLVQLGLRLTTGPYPMLRPLLVGQIAVHDEEFATPPAPTALEFQPPERTITGGVSVRLAWEPPADESAVHHYEIYETGGGASGTFLGASLNPVFFLPQLTARDRAATQIAVTAVGHDGTHSPNATADITW